MALTADQVRWVAHLARLELTPDEVAEFTGQLNQIVEYVNQLQAVNTDGVEPLSHPLPVQNVFRDDDMKQSLSAQEALANAPARKINFFAVPAVLD
jgi:aspartyl-tRNA(Asn)/glutamyl-tRNA(Gln) amidotransferase subunit C